MNKETDGTDRDGDMDSPHMEMWVAVCRDMSNQ